MDILKSINRIQQDVFNLKVSEMDISINEFIVFLDEFLKSNDIDNILLNNILNEINFSIINNDYLYLSDLFEYELKPILLNGEEDKI